MTRLFIAAALALVALTAPLAAAAQALAPDALIRPITDEVLATIRHDKELRAGEPASRKSDSLIRLLAAKNRS